jgi:hypothetical protein
MMGFVAKDKNYIRFSQIDPHSIFTSWIIPPGFVPVVDLDNMDDEEITGYCKKIKKHDIYGVLRQKVAKPCVLGNQLGLGPMRFYRQNQPHVRSLAHGRQLQARLGEGFPKVERFKLETRDRGERQTYLQNYYGRVQRFYEVYRWSYDKRAGKWKKGFGSESDKTIGFEVQSNAFDMLIEKVLEAGKKGWLERYLFCNTIHDSLIFLPQRGQLDNCIADIGQLLVSPSTTLVNEAAPNGLRVGVEWAAGRNWKKWHETENPEGMKEGGVLA